MLLPLGDGICLIHLAFLKPAIWGLDGNEVLQVAHSLVTQQSFVVSPLRPGAVLAICYAIAGISLLRKGLLQTE